METCSGKSVCRGIAIGKLYLLKNKNLVVEKKAITDCEKEHFRFEKAIQGANEQLEHLYEDALIKVGQEQANIIEVQMLMLQDEGYLEDIKAMILDSCVNAEFAVSSIGNQYAEQFRAMDDEYMNARATDVLDVSERLVRILMGIVSEGIVSDEPVIILADDLTPSETIQMDKTKILAFVTRQGSANSHTAILARTMNIPSLVTTNITLDESYHGKTAVVDGFSGVLLIEPTEEIVKEKEKLRFRWVKAQEELKKLIGAESITRDGRSVKLYANIGNHTDVEKVLENDAEGIGLFRSEFIYLESEDYPTEEDQFQIYKEVVEKMNGKKVIIRTLDIGADKQAEYFQLPKEENPAMGFRAIRICLERPELFKTQLRAIYRAAYFGTVSVMFPMIISMEEIKKIKEIVETVKSELKQEGKEIGSVELGIMIETPAAVLISDELAKEVEFFSIGTNDLTQYTLAIDRQNQQLESFYNAHHKAILKMIKMTVENAHKAGIWVGICGELAGDETLTDTFLTMGVDELSVSPPLILKLRQTVRNL